METKTIKQTIIIKANPQEVYESLTDPKKHSEFTGSRATGTNKLGNFTAYDDYASGENLKLIKDKLIVQTWTCTDFPEGYYTEATFELNPIKEGQTQLTFTQKNIPSKNYKSISDGWTEFYWKPLKDYLER